MKKQMFFIWCLALISVKMESVQLWKNISDVNTNNSGNHGSINLNPDFYISVFQKTEQQINDIREIFEQEDVKRYCGNQNKDWFLSCSSETTTICEKRTNKICGILNHDTCFIESGQKCGYIYLLAIHKDYRKLGLASQLLYFVEEKYKKEDGTWLSLYVFNNNKNAVALYVKHGFKKNLASYG